MKLSVVVPAYNESGCILNLLGSLQKQERVADEIIVVNNNSTDEMVALIQKNFPKTRIINEQQKGAVYARERGFHEAIGDVLCRTDADCVVPPNWLANIEQFFLSNKNCVGVTGPVLYIEKPTRFFGKWPSVFFSYLFLLLFRHGVLLGPNCAIRKETHRKATFCLERSRFGDLHEDLDLAQHLAPHGKIGFDNKIWVWSSARRIQGSPHQFFGTYTLMLFHHLFKHQV